MPYTDGNCSLQPNSEQISNALNYKINNFKRITESDFKPSKINNLLMQNEPIIIGLRVYSNFVNARTGFVYDTIEGTYKGNHAVVICGFDDNKNAYRVINSWGTNWGDRGYFWLDYDFMKDIVFEAYIIEVNNTQTSKSIQLLGDLNFGSINVGSSLTKALIIKNTGTSSLSVSSINCPTGFSGNWSGTISAGNSKSVNITFSPNNYNNYNNYNGVITVNSDASSGNNTISCSGTGGGNTGTGRVTLYMAVSGVGWIDVSLLGNSYRLAYHYLNGSAPPCGETHKAVTLTLNVGTYNYTARSAFGHTYSGSFTIINNDCVLVGIK